MAEKLLGVVQWFDTKKGYGFIRPEKGGKDIFAHFSGISGDGYKQLYAGEPVSFEISKNDKGEVASNIESLATQEEKAQLSRPVNRVNRQRANVQR